MTPHSLACNMLRQAGKLDFRDLPPPRRTESVIDWLVRAGVAKCAQQAAKGLLVAAELDSLHTEMLAEINS